MEASKDDDNDNDKAATVLKHGMVGCTTRGSVRTVVHPLFM